MEEPHVPNPAPINTSFTIPKVITNFQIKPMDFPKGLQAIVPITRAISVNAGIPFQGRGAVGGITIKFPFP